MTGESSPVPTALTIICLLVLPTLRLYEANIKHVLALSLQSTNSFHNYFMSSTLRTTFYCFLILLIHHTATAQDKSIIQQEYKLVKLYQTIVSFDRNDSDSTGFYADAFEEQLSGLITNNPATLNYAFEKLKKEGCYIISSEDSNYRIYSWDTWTGSTMHFFKTIYQWRSGNKVFVKKQQYEEGDAGSFCSKIFTVQAGDKTYYLPVTNGIFSTKDVMQSIAVYCINGNQLIDTVHLFRTKTRQFRRIDVSFDFFSVVDRPERPVELITYDDKQKKVYIPVVNNKAGVTKKKIVYQLRDGYFEFTGIE